jgi:HlyD family secretion protein
LSGILLATLLAAALRGGCGTLVKTAPPPVPTLVLDSAAAPAAQVESEAPRQSSSGVTASGNVIPAQVAQIASTQGGNILSLDAEVGERVEAGQVLVRLAGSEKLAAVVEATRLELLSAQQALDDLKENAGQERSRAQLRLATAKDELDKAEKRRGWKEYRPGDDNQIAVARADLIVAEDTLRKTQEVYGGYADSPEDNLNKAAGLSALAAARQARERALANLNYLLNLPGSVEVEKADAVLAMARSEMEAAQAQFERLKDGPEPKTLALAEARVKNAAAQLTAAQAVLADLELKAPFAGTVSKVGAHASEWVMPGQAILTLADVEHLRVETSDLSERDVPLVSEGQAAVVRIKALGLDATGRVSQISPLADTLGGDVVYTVTLDFDSIPAGLRAGMSVEVDFAAAP